MREAVGTPGREGFRALPEVQSPLRADLSREEKEANALWFFAQHNKATVFKNWKTEDAGDGTLRGAQASIARLYNREIRESPVGFNPWRHGKTLAPNRYRQAQPGLDLR